MELHVAPRKIKPDRPRGKRECENVFGMHLNELIKLHVLQREERGKDHTTESEELDKQNGLNSGMPCGLVGIGKQRVQKRLGAAPVWYDISMACAGAAYTSVWMWTQSRRRVGAYGVPD